MYVLVVPCFNEERRWDGEYWRRMQTLDDVSWLIVDDGSTDSTAQLAMDTSLSSRWRVLRLASNVGKGEAVRVGLHEALSAEGVEGVGFMDGDGAFAVDDVARLCGLARDGFSGDSRWDAVWSSRVMLAGRRILRSPRRHYLGRVVATYLSVGREPLPYDTQSGLKIFSACESLERCIEHP
ncbi:MAG TPA: glycosyltransferase, partial [Acidimicrobiales bacterium]|nr:glycosyltransferase [Acidimicrobiales bacterium]